MKLPRSVNAAWITTVCMLAMQWGCSPQPPTTTPTNHGAGDGHHRPQHGQPQTIATDDSAPIVTPSDLPPAPTTSATSAPPTSAADGPRPVAAVAPILLPKPPFVHTVKDAIDIADAPAPALKQLRVSRNQIIDNEQWFKRHQLPKRGLHHVRDRTTVPKGVPLRLGALELISSVTHAQHRFVNYGIRRRGAFVLALQDNDGDTKAVYDFSKYLRAPRVVKGDEQFVDQDINWAEQRDGVLYLANGHSTYAKSSHGQNAYITAIDAKTGKLRWRSASLVANAHSFVITDAHIISGYGFTDELDYLYLLNRSDGKTVRRIKLNSGPREIIEKDGKLFVRCYNTDYEFSL